MKKLKSQYLEFIKIGQKELNKKYPTIIEAYENIKSVNDAEEYISKNKMKLFYFPLND